ncbi:MAG: hypothetical protein FD152_3879, partial [Xanthobacteraceae bacterium]
MDFVFAIVVAIAVVLGLPILAIAAFVRSGDAKRRLNAVEMRLRQAETELGLIRAGLAAGQTAPAAPAVPASEAGLVPTGAPVAASPAEPLPALEPAVAEPAAAEPVAARRTVP